MLIDWIPMQQQAWWLGRDPDFDTTA